jgi:hypothetical protein
MRKLSAVAFIAMMITAPLPAIAYTQEDADACTPDAMRLCQQAIPDESRVALCLVQNKRQLSPRLYHRVQSSACRKCPPASAR